VSVERTSDYHLPWMWLGVGIFLTGGSCSVYIMSAYALNGNTLMDLIVLLFIVLGLRYFLLHFFFLLYFHF
jgi:hypothetical protein